MKNIKNALLILIFSCSFLSGNAQEKQLKIKDYLNREVYPDRIQNLQWMTESGVYSYVENNSLIRESVTGKDSDTLIGLQLLNSSLKNNSLDTLRRFPSIAWIDKHTFRFRSNRSYIRYNIKDNKPELILSYPENAEHEDYHKESGKIAYTKGQNLFITYNNKEIQVTYDTVDGIENGKAAHRREFGISKGTFWSPSGDMLGFYHMDESMVSEYPLVKTDTRVAETKMIRYPMAGMTSHQVKIGVYNIKKNKTIYLKTGIPKEKYLTNITWGPNEKYIYVAVLNRDQDHLHLNKYNAENGDLIKTLFEEKSSRYVEPEHELYFPENRKDQFIWFSERDGFQHLYLYNTEGDLIKQLTAGEWLVQDIIGYDSRAERLYFYGTRNSPLNRDAFSVNLSDGEITTLTPDEGTHSIMPGAEFKYFIDEWSSLEMGRAYCVLSADSEKLTTLKQDKNPLKEYNTGETVVSSLKADDGTRLYYRMIKPHDFDESKKYPVYIYVYGGPHAQLVTNSHLGGGNIYLNYLASKGYIVFTLDNRGSDDRGFEFESTIHRRLGEIEVADQMEGVKYLKSLDFVDTTRIGVNGWSYGGFMTLSMLLQHPGTFKVGVAGGPVTDWKYYEVMYGERYMDTPQSNPEGYKDASLLNEVSNLDSRLMIIHGTLDPTVVWQQSREFVRACVKEGKLLDYFIYPGHEHNVRGKDRIHLYKKIAQYFEDYL